MTFDLAFEHPETRPSLKNHNRRHIGGRILPSGGTSGSPQGSGQNLKRRLNLTTRARVVSSGTPRPRVSRWSL